MDPFVLSPEAAVGLLGDAPWRRFAVAGDSLSRGTGDPRPGYPHLGWADQVAAYLRAAHPGVEYLNTAVDGATTAETMDAQFGRIVDFAPELLHLPCGANDIVRRRPDYGEIAAGLRRMYEAASRTGALLTTFTLGRAYVVPVFEDWRDRVLTVNAVVRELAAEYGAVVVDMWDHPVNDRPGLVSADRIHFAAYGQTVMASEVVRALAAHAGRSGHRAPPV